MSIRNDGTAHCDGCDRLLDGDSIHAAASLLDLTPSGDVARFQLCRDYRDAAGKIVTGCVNRALTVNAQAVRDGSR